MLSYGQFDHEQILLEYFNQNTTISIKKNPSKNTVCKMVAILFRPQYVIQGWF